MMLARRACCCTRHHQRVAVKTQTVRFVRCRASPSQGTSSNTPTSGSDPASAVVFRGLALTSLVAGGAAFLAPEFLTHLANTSGSAPSSSLDAVFCRIAGATLAISVAVEWSLAEAAAAGRLGSATYQMLLAALVPKNVLYIGALALVRAHAAALLCCCVLYMPCILPHLQTHTAHSHIHTQQTPAAFSPLTAALYLPAPLLSLAAAARALSAPPAPTADANSSGGTNSFSALAAAAFARPTTAAGWGYLAAGLLYVFTLAACYAPEEALFTGGDATTPLALLLKRTWAPGFWMAGAACAVLRDAADRGRLGASTFRRLNWGIAALETGYAATYAAAIASGLAAGGGPAASNLGGSVAIAAFAAWQAAGKRDK